MTWRAFVQPGTILFVALWLILMIGGQSRFLQDPGTFWHTVTGQRILESRTFINTDPYTFTFGGTPWVPYQWLGECIFAMLHAIDGLDTLLLTTVTLVSGLFTWLGVRLMRCGLHPSLAMLLIAFAVAASSGHFHVRPHVATMWGFAVMMVFLVDCEANRRKLGRLTWLIPVFWVWSNIHGGALGGMATLALAFAGWTLAWAIGWNSPVSSFKQVGQLGLIWVGCAGSAFVNPYGADLPEVWIYIYRMPSLPFIIKEHSRTDFADRAAWTFAGFGLIYVALLATTLPGKPRVVWLLPLVWLALGFARVRHAPLFAILALIAIADFFPLTRIARLLQAKGSDLFEAPEAHPEPAPRSQKLAAFAIPVTLVLVSLVLQIARVPVPVIGHGWARLDPELWPVDFLDELKQGQYDRPGGTRIFNEYGLGGFLIYYTPGYRVFVDDRCEVFGDAWLNDFVHATDFMTKEHLDNWQKEYGPFDYALVNPEGGFAGYFDARPDEWELLKKTETMALYKRK